VRRSDELVQIGERTGKPDELFSDVGVRSGYLFDFIILFIGQKIIQIERKILLPPLICDYI